MKININITAITLFLAFGLLCSFGMRAQENHTVALYVDTEAIQTNTPDPDLGRVCNFGQGASVSNEDYLIEVNANDIIKWVGVAQNGTDIVNIEMIRYSHGPNPFPNGRRDIPGVGAPGKSVTAQVTEGTGRDSCKYIVMFTVIRNGEPLNRMFNIDPRLRVR